MAAGGLSRQITPEPPPEAALNFNTLVDVGIDAAQRVSGDLWTDYNAHDPGVTILEALAYALTDVAYRASHPIEDIIASSLAETGTRVEDQPLFTGDRILSGGPDSEADLRKLAYDRARDLRNLWLRATSTPGLYQPVVQFYAGTSAAKLSERKAEVLADVARLLDANRPLGVDFLYPVGAPLCELMLNVQIEIAPERAAESVLADILYRLDHRLNPTPQLNEIGRDLNDGVAPDIIFNGPRLNVGWIAAPTLDPYEIDLPLEIATETILATPGVTGLVRFDDPDWRCADDPKGVGHRVALGREPDDLKRVKISSNGNWLDFEPERVFAYLTHIEESARWRATYASHKTDELDYVRLPLGNAGRRLSRYRSVQHLFPPAYALGTDFDGRRRSARDVAARLQLKAYLMFFEQIIANALAQVSHTATLLSFAEQDRTYYVAPVDRADGDLDAPPDIEAVLGEPGDQNWREDYVQALQALESELDPVSVRLNAALSALLARFGAGFPDERLARFRDRQGNDPVSFPKWLVTQKRRRLSRLPEVEGRRAIGANVAAMRASKPGTVGPSEETSIEETIRCLSGHDGLLAVVEHVLLRPLAQSEGIGTLRIGRDFRIRSAPPFRAVRLRLGKTGLHLAPRDRPKPWTDWPALIGRFVELAARDGTFKTQAPEAYELCLALCDRDEPVFDVVETFANRAQARFAAAGIAEAARKIRARECEWSEVLTPAKLPLDFFAGRVSVALALPEDDIGNGRPEQDRDYKNFVATIVRARMPAHLRAFCFWLEPEEAKAFETAFRLWCDSLRATRSANPDPASLRTARDAANDLRQRIETLYAGEVAGRRPANRFEPLEPPK